MSVRKIREQALRELEDKYGRVTARALVDAARSTKHPLHNHFVWDNAIAGDKYRLDQARAIIASVRMEVRIGQQTYSSVGYVRDPEAAPHQGYRNVTALRSDRDVAIEALVLETDRVAAIMERALEVACVLELEEEFRSAIESITLLRTTIRRRTTAAPEARPTV